MIFKPWAATEFEARGFVQAGAVDLWERSGFPLYSSTKAPRKVWTPKWAAELFRNLSNRQFEPEFWGNIARLSAAAIRSDDPDTFVESVLAAYALGGWHATLQFAEAQGEAHVGPA